MSEAAVENANSELAEALESRRRLFSKSIDRLRELASDEAENEVYDITFLLREAVEFTGCLRRLVTGRTAEEIHKAFGAPGDFGYETPIGEALARLYRAECERRQAKEAADASR